MVEIISRTRQRAHFRIEIKDLVSGKTKTISLVDHSNKTLEDLKMRISNCLGATKKL